KKENAQAAAGASAGTIAVSAPAPPVSRARALVQAMQREVLPPVMGAALFILLWALVSATTELPSPLKTWQSALQVFSDPFYQKGPNDQGIGWNILRSLARVGMGFGAAALVGIPLGFLLGYVGFLNRMFTPIISVLRPVSPLAWLPIGLYVFKQAQPAAIWVIFISILWPRVLKLSPWKLFSRILLPAVLPYVLTGVRLSIGVAWLVIVAAEMLTGGVGLGFWIWDEWNNLNVEHIIIAIFVVGFVGLALEQAILLMARRFRYER